MRALVTTSALLFLTSCATMVNGRYQQVKVDSFPGHAAIAVECGAAPHDGGFTPATLTLPRRADTCEVVLSKEGYVDRAVVFERQVSRATAANRIAGVPVAMIGAVVGIFIDDTIGLDGDVTVAGWTGGMEAGSAPGRQIDKHTGGAYKWVPADVFVTLIRREPEQ